MKKNELSRLLSIVSLFLSISIQSFALSDDEFSVLLLIGVFLSLVGLLDLGYGHQLFTNLIENQRGLEDSNNNKTKIQLNLAITTSAIFFPVIVGTIFFQMQSFDLGSNRYCILVFYELTILLTAIFALFSKILIAIGGIHEQLRITFTGSIIQLVCTSLTFFVYPKIIGFQVSLVIALLSMILMSLIFCRSKIQSFRFVSHKFQSLLMPKMQFLQLLQVLSQILFTQLLFICLTPQLFSQFQVLSKIYLSVSSILLAEMSLDYWRKSSISHDYVFKISRKWIVRHLLFGGFVTLVTLVLFDIFFDQLPGVEIINLLVWLCISVCFSCLQLLYFYNLGKDRFHKLFASATFQVAFPIIGLIFCHQLSSFEGIIAFLTILVVPMLILNPVKTQRV